MQRSREKGSRSSAEVKGSGVKGSKGSAEVKVQCKWCRGQGAAGYCMEVGLCVLYVCKAS